MGSSCVGAGHLLSQSCAGVIIQIDMAMIASLLISLWTKQKPTRRTYEMLCLHLSSWATADEVEVHLAKRRSPKPPPRSS